MHFSLKGQKRKNKKKSGDQDVTQDKKHNWREKKGMLCGYKDTNRRKKQTNIQIYKISINTAGQEWKTRGKIKRKENWNKKGYPWMKRSI